MDLIDSKNKYYSQNIGKVWSFPGHYKSYENAKWKWGDFPFADKWKYDFYKPIVKNKLNNIAILEIGSAMGGAYKFLSNTGLIDMSNYTGIEVSDTGYNYISKKFPQAKWIHADFTKFDLTDEYDYSFERISVHHMYDPITQYKKILKKTNISAMFTFRGCVSGNTISDLDKACFVEDDGLYFCNIINVFELVTLGLKNNFNDIRILFGGLHEPFIRDIEIAKKNKGFPYVKKNIDLEKKHVSRFQVRFRKNDNINHSRIYLTSNPINIIKYTKTIYLLYTGIRNLKLFDKISKIRI